MVDSLINPLLQYKMPLFDRTGASAGLSNPKAMSDYLNKQTPQYGEAYFPFDPREKEGSQFASPWGNSKTSLLDGESSTSRLSGTEGKQHMLFRQNSSSSKERTPQLSPLHASPVKQGFRLYSKSPGSSSSTAAPPVSVGKPRSGSDDTASVPLGSPVYLAVPKPVYGHSPCCSELCFVRGQYCVASGFPRLPHPVYKHNWMQSDAQYSDAAAVQKKAQDALLQHGGLQFDAGAERLKRMETFSPGRVRPFPPIISPNYGSYPCTFFDSFGEQRQQQSSPRAYPHLFPSQHAYEHMTSEVYQEHSPMTKYGHATQRPVFYYSQADMEVENKGRCKNSGSKPRGESPVTVKHALPSPQEHFMVSRPLHSEAPLPHFQHRTLLPGFGYPCYGAPRYNVGARQSMHSPPVVPSNNVHFSPANLCPDYHVASATSLQEDGARLGAGRSDASSSFIRVDQSNPPRRSNQPVVPTTSIAMNGLFHPPGSLNRPGLQAHGLNVEGFLSYSPSGGQVRCVKLPSIHPMSLGPELQPPLHHYPDLRSKAAHHSNVQTNVCSSSVKTEKKPDDTTSSFKSCLKRSPPVHIKEERDWEEDGPLKKWRKMKGMETTWVRRAAESPPMPVIDNVFSLAPHQAHVQPSGALFPGRTLHSAVRSEVRAVQMPSDVNEKRKDENENPPLDCQVSKETRAGAPARTPPELRKPQEIKVEKDTSDDFAANPGDQRGPPTTAGGKHSEETGATRNESSAGMKKREPEELEMKPSAVESATAGESHPGDSVVQASNAEVACQPNPSVQSPPTEQRVSFKNIPPCCLKLSTYNIVPPKAKCASPAPAPEKPTAPPATKDLPNLDVQLPVRKHFYELHHSLYKLISKSVFATSEQELRTFLSRLELAEIVYPSCKIKNMSSLLGVKPRELWFSEEVKSVLNELVKRLTEYTSQERCPFPHVMRTSTVFLPMLVLKELLFPMVQSSFIDQVLQEHRVELRPTTLSEEKILLQLHKRACSSRLRKLMSLKHLPDIYADMVNILYYTCISKHLGKCMIQRCCTFFFFFAEILRGIKTCSNNSGNKGHSVRAENLFLSYMI